MHYGDNAVRFGTKGGHRRAIYNPDGLLEFEPPRNPSDLLSLLATTIIEARAGKIDPRVANTLFYGSTAFLNAFETADLDARLKVLEGRRNAKH